MAFEFYGICYLSTNGQKVLVMRIEWRMAIKKIQVINPELDCRVSISDESDTQNMGLEFWKFLIGVPNIGMEYVPY